MPRLDPSFLVHHLVVYIDATPIKKKLHKKHLQIALLVKAKLQKLSEAGFIKPIDYLKWVSNIVPVSKPTRAIHIHTYFRDLK